ncbi:hypothetical protein [Flammeovirga agarivorans]|uniref:Uncharacterized protein n=1 Tax=Flammeovirga agarivorans TaxID=2726742 RepID=A0A7X8SG28_9BACT|nr:hypothetical protein [Flammeovirga agarivorans]NLR89591.1 hypothetical protein [Flammeovirga agarivorans]
MRQLLIIQLLFVLLSSTSFAQLIPVEIDLSKKNLTYPFTPVDMPMFTNNTDDIQLTSPVSVLKEDGSYVTGNIKFVAGSLDNIVTQIHVKDQQTGEKVKLKLEEIKSIVIATSKDVNLNTVVNQHESISYIGDKDLSQITVTKNQVSYFEKVMISKGKKQKAVLLQAINYEQSKENDVTVFYDPKGKNTQVKVNLVINEPGYKFKGAVMEFVPNAYYIKNNTTGEVVHISEKEYKKSMGTYPETIFTDASVIERLKEGNKASVNKYSEDNWAFFLMNAINYNLNNTGEASSTK